jgi:TonB-linked SusC/RagA family outer membrane protein
VTDIEEVVITAERMHSEGTFAIPQREISTAVQTINMEEMEGIQVTSIDDALQGRLSGLDIVANSGDIGSGATMRVRGATSINASNEPLIVVNNIPYEVDIDPTFDFANANEEQYANMLSLNPDDIESITLLKDAASTAVWGSKGANGVLVIKTKKAAQGPTRVQYTYRFTRAVQPQGLKLLNGDDYTMMVKQAYFNPRQDEDAANVSEFLYDPQFSEYENFNNNTDWFKEVTQTGFKHDHYITLSGGGGRARYRVAGGFFNQRGTVIGQEMRRMSSRSYLEYWVSDRIQFISEFAFTFSDYQRNWSGSGYPNDLSLLAIAYKKMPNVSVYQQDLYGNNTDVFYNIPRSSSLHSSQRDLRNPVALAHLGKNNLKNYRIIPTLRLQYYLLDPEVQLLRYNMYVSFDVNNNKVSKFLPREVSNLPWNDNMVNLAEGGDSENMTVLADNNISFQPRFGNTDHSMLLYGSFQIRTGFSASQGIATANLPSGEIVDPVAAGYISDISTSRSSYRSNALLFRMHYAYKSRYILDFTIRRDGSTKFGEDNKYGNFPGISGKWIISDEPFMQWSNNWLSMLAFRPSWGISGNQPNEEYLHFSRYQPYGSYIGMTATRPTSLQLSNLKWETTTQYNYGFDLGLLGDRIVVEANIYRKRTEDLLFRDLKLASSSGFGDIPWQNIGTMDNNGWEIYFQTFDALRVGDFSWDFNFNLHNLVNRIVELDEDVLSIYNSDFDYSNGTYLSRIQEGNSYGSIYGFRYKGVYRYNDYIPGVQEDAPVARDENGNVILGQDGQPLPMYFAFGRSNAYEFRGGDARYEDINHDGNIDELDIVYLGNSNPKLNGGFGSSIRYKNLRLTAFFNFRIGNKIVNAARMNAENMYYLDNQSISVNWRWRKDGDLTEMPRALYDYGYNWLGSDRYVEDGSFVRFKYLTIDYSVPVEKLRKYFIQRLSLYLTFNNLAVITKYTGVDPEVGYSSFDVSMDRANTPRSKDFTLGMSITF